MQRFVVWDLDGTLLDSGDDIAFAANEARVSLGMEALPPHVVRSFVGEGAARLMQRVIGEDREPALHKAGLDAFLAVYGQHLWRTTRPYPGLDALVHRLEGRQAIATNKPGALARRLVTHAGWDGCFRATVGGGDVERRKPAPDAVFHALELSGVALSDAIFVGDSPIDIETARNAGIDFVCVSWGLRPREELVSAPRLVDTAEELARVLGA